MKLIIQIFVIFLLPSILFCQNKNISTNKVNAESYAIFRRGELKDKQGDKVGALKDYNKAIALDPNFSYFDRRGFLKFLQKDYHGALIDYNKVIELNPYAEAYNIRGNIKCFLEDKQGAMKDYNKCIELDPESGNAYITEVF